ncbi:hypothetical protein L6R53_31370 [Myxococcota bacterium]|nr:hypothetical protein [Myxococcota bacterium]
MPKVVGEVFPEAQRESATDGTARQHRHPPQKVKSLGQGSKLIIQGRVVSRDAPANLQIRVFTGSLGNELPADYAAPVELNDGTTGGLLVVTISSVGVFTIETEGTLQANTEITASVVASSGTSTVRMIFELWTTIVIS